MPSPSAYPATTTILPSLNPLTISYICSILAAISTNDDEPRRAKSRERSRRFRETHREWWNEYHRSYRAKVRSDPERQSLAAARRRAQYLQNRERLMAEQRARHRRRYERDPESIRQWSRRYRAKNLEQTRLLTRLSNQRRRVRGAGPVIPVSAWRELLAQYDHCCGYCGERVTLEADHRIPIARGGPHTIENLIPACVRCNRRKHTKTEEEFRRFLGGTTELGEDAAPYRLSA